MQATRQIAVQLKTWIIKKLRLIKEISNVGRNTARHNILTLLRNDLVNHMIL